MTEGQQIRDYIHIDKVVTKLESISRLPKSNGIKISHIASGEPIRLKDFADYWWQHWGATGNLQFGILPYRTYESMRIVAKI